MKHKLTILIVDDSNSVRADLCTLLNLLDGVEVVGEAADVQGALRRAHALKPDLVIMDLELGAPSQVEMDGCSVIRQLKASQSAPVIYVLTVHGYAAARQAALRSGADAFFIKGQDVDGFLNAIRQHLS